MVKGLFVDLPISLRPHWHIIGDSHLNSFRRAYERKLINRPCLFTEVGGATAVGLRNPNSKTNALETFKAALLPKRRNKTPVIQLGEVDCGFVIWYRAQKYGENIDTQFTQSVDAYMEFVDTLRRHGYKNIVLTGATLPTIRDGQTWGHIANLRREVTATLSQRTDLTMRYNAQLKAAAQQRSLPFIDLSELALDPDSGMIREEFRHSDPTDHHLDPDKVGALWAAELNRLSQEIS
jgi:hypothetical protein